MSDSADHVTCLDSTPASHADAAGTPQTDAGRHLGPVDACPECGAQEFSAQNHDDTVVFECVSCRVAWRYELSYVWPVRVDR